MILQPFAPPLDSQWRLTLDWTPSAAFMDNRENSKTLFDDDFSTRWREFNKIKPHPGHTSPGYEQWSKDYDDYCKTKRASRSTPKFEAGTVIVFDRYHVSHSGDHAITIRILAAPDPLLHPKKLKGLMKGPGRLYLKVSDLNSLPPLEQVTEKVKP